MIELDPITGHDVRLRIQDTFIWYDEELVYVKKGMRMMIDVLTEDKSVQRVILPNPLIRFASIHKVYGYFIHRNRLYYASESVQVRGRYKDGLDPIRINILKYMERAKEWEKTYLESLNSASIVAMGKHLKSALLQEPVETDKFIIHGARTSATIKETNTTCRLNGAPIRIRE